MTTSPPSSSEAHSQAFASLHDGVRRWIWQQGWAELHDVQEQAIPAILAGDHDVIVIAATAGGKTEAAFLPIISRIASDREPGFKALYISPLKALINDQFRRLDDLCESLEVPVWRWHGDVSDAIKRRARARPDGIVLITPESFEGLFVRRGSLLRNLFGNLRYVVIDEFHAFLDSERGVQLLSLLRRLEAAVTRRIPRIALSATLGDPACVRALLRPDEPDGVIVIESKAKPAELRLQVRGYVLSPPLEVRHGEASYEAARLAVDREIADHLFSRLRGTSNLVFSGSRKNVELFSDRLREMSVRAGVPNEFFPHHGSLARELREELEARLKDAKLPTTAITTTTLELGIDIGAVDSVAQIGPPRSVSGLRQRLGRSGRRAGKPAVLRVYIRENNLGPGSSPKDQLRLRLVQTIAVINLLLRSSYEPPRSGGYHLSTLLHQILASIAQSGGLTAAQLHDLLFRGGPFDAVPREVFVRLLRRMGDGETRLIEQAPDGTLLLGEQGERLVEHYSFYAVFQSPEEYRIIASEQVLGTLPVDSPLMIGNMIIFAGRRWLIREVDATTKTIMVDPAAGGVPPPFADGGTEWLDHRVAAEMRDVFMGCDTPVFLDDSAANLLAEAREAFTRFGLSHTNLIEFDGRLYFFPWTGTVALSSFALALRAQGVSAMIDDVFLEIEGTSIERCSLVFAAITDSPPTDAVVLAGCAEDTAREKYDGYLSDELRSLNYARAMIDADCIPDLARAGLACLSGLSRR